VRTGRDVVDWVTPIEAALRMIEPRPWQQTVDERLRWNCTRARRLRRSWSREVIDLCREARRVLARGELTILVWLELYARATERTLAPELLSDVPDEASVPLR